MSLVCCACLLSATLIFADHSAFIKAYLAEHNVAICSAKLPEFVFVSNGGKLSFNIFGRSVPFVNTICEGLKPFPRLVQHQNYMLHFHLSSKAYL